ncbi:MAG: GNAT family N-acetyltransferase, partial [Gemmatimonadales bacterium]
ILTAPLPAATVDCWHDRAVFHFLTDAADQAQYVAKVQQVLRPGGYLLVATFAADGPLRCSGLPTARYSSEELEQVFGSAFRPMATRREEHRTPTGALQAFTYGLFRYEPAGRDALPPARLSFTPVVETERLLLRSWRPEDAPRLKAAIDANLDHLRAWMPWAMHEPSPLEVLSARLARFERDFAAGLDATYGLFARDDGRILGSTGFHLRIPAGVEIGYWLDHREQGKGFVTEASAALTTEAFRHPEVTRVQIRCDPRNQRSAAVPQRLGYRLIGTLVADAHAPDGSRRDTMIWEIDRHATA